MGLMPTQKVQSQIANFPPCGSHLVVFFKTLTKLQNQVSEAAASELGLRNRVPFWLNARSRGETVNPGHIFMTALSGFFYRNENGSL